MSRFVPVDRDTAYLLPPSVDEWLPDDRLARFVVEVIERLDLDDLVKQYAGRGSAAHHPAVLLGLLIYGYANGVHSSRKIERATYDSVAFRYVAANTHPDHDTLATFRRRFLKEVEALFVQVLVLAREMELLRLGHIAQAGVDTETMTVITAHVTQACNDKREVVPTLEQIRSLPAVLGEVKSLITDNGFYSQANVVACAQAGIEPLLTIKRESHHEPLMERFAPDVDAPQTTDQVANMVQRLSTQAGKALYKLRKQTVEPVFGIIKRVMGWRQMSMSGLAKARGEWSLVTMAWNIKRMHVLRAA